MAFQNKDINEKIKILNGTSLNIFNNFIPNKTSKSDYKISVWLNEEVTLLLKKDRNLLINATITLHIITKVWRLMRQMNVPD